MFKRVYLFYVSYLAVITYSHMLLLMWFLRHGATTIHLLLFFFTTYTTALLFLTLLNKKSFSIKISLALGIVLSAIALLSTIWFFTLWQIITSGILFGIQLIFFWVTYNILHFRLSVKQETGFKSGLYFLFIPLLGIALQPLAGWVAERFGFSTVFISGVIAHALPLSLLLLLPNQHITFKPFTSFSKVPIKTLTFLQGFIQVANFSLIPLITLTYITTPTAYGLFFSYLATIAAVANIINARFSDKMRSRRSFFYVFSIGLSISLLLMTLVTDTSQWHLIAGIVGVMIVLVNPFWLAAAIDYSNQASIEELMATREFMLNAGRSAGLLLTIISLATIQSLIPSIAVFTVAALAYPFIAYKQKLYS